MKKASRAGILTSIEQSQSTWAFFTQPLQPISSQFCILQRHLVKSNRLSNFCLKGKMTEDLVSLFLTIFPIRLKLLVMWCLILWSETMTGLSKRELALDQESLIFGSISLNI